MTLETKVSGDKISSAWANAIKTEIEGLDSKIDTEIERVDGDVAAVELFTGTPNTLHDDLLARYKTLYTWHYTNRIAETYLSPDGPGESAYREWLLPLGLQIYLMSGETAYLTVAKAAADSFYNGRNTTYDLPRAANSLGTRQETELYWEMELIHYLGTLAMIDTTYAPKYKEIIDGAWTYGVDDTNKLCKYNVKSDGTCSDYDSDLAYSGGNFNHILLQLTQFLLGGDTTYLTRCENIISAIWALKNGTTNIIPHRINWNTGAVMDSWCNQYDISSWLEIMLGIMLYTKYTTIDSTDIAAIADATATAVDTYYWHTTSYRWKYRVNQTGTDANAGAEGFFGMLSHAMIMYDLWKGVSTHLTKADQALRNGYTALRVETTTGKYAVEHASWITPTEARISMNQSFIKGAAAMYALWPNPTHLNNILEVEANISDCWTDNDGIIYNIFYPDSQTKSSFYHSWYDISEWQNLLYRQHRLNLMPLNTAVYVSLPQFWLRTGFTAAPHLC